MAFGKDTFNLEKQFTFYASYHNNPVNVAIHMICIWPILATGLVLLQLSSFCSWTHLPTPDCLQKLPLGLEAPLNLALVVALIYVVSYMLMEPVVGGIAALFVTALYFGSWNMVSEDWHVGGYPVWRVALVIFIMAWIIQFIGHGVFEGRAPALLDSLDQALLTAPLFVLLEVFFFLGYRKGFHQKIMKQVAINVKKFKEGNKKGQ
ncbi:hypothetical protein TCAL_06489 [Tigriopus californicus]|uniref:DUF962 domain-containing protein n=1 Tax=Tigriopus californicus TaxID=6832 RepID=A0A553PS92_TIGCA|nr:uncharacterized protein LOC131891549 [Tigriopus californicus]TRY80556.1 hypothetical protein TCAL_06489 [Tigriopus californicus]|eukprot:TCALIF_06489-PA protein Name:"Similar to SPAC16E8.02 Uncharacterized endoplasmic reticulum membrane protein C16E8.02 (Schizosaccharomyces pombe (strain 972 / ATCC 24843))" AED:0.05 eAED:0.05 QI:49/1/1/1/1/1/4/49/205